MPWLEQCQAVFMCVCLFATDNNIRQDSIYHNMATLHSTGQPFAQPPPSSFLVDLGFGLSSTHIHTNAHIQTHIKWLISEKARITSRQTWRTRQSQPPRHTPFVSQRRLMDQSQATNSPLSSDQAKELGAYYQHHCHISSNERAATMAANPIMT